MRKFQYCLLFHLGILCFINAQEVEVIGEIRVDSIEILDGAGQDKVLISDENGSATWQDIGIKKRHVISPGMMKLFFGGAVIDSFPTSIALPNAGSPGVTLSIPIPSNYLASSVKVRILYTSTSATGTFAFNVYGAGVAIGDNTIPSSSLPPPFILSAPTTAFHLMEAVSPDIPSVTSDTRMINLTVFRSSADVNDSSTGVLKLIGLIMEYN